jgi:hydrogenase nickel incorporation protein HypA/HybF
MHELSIAQSIVDYALSETERQNAKKVTELDVDVGELMQVDTKVLLNALNMLMTDPRLKDCEVRVRATIASFSCRRCSSTWGMAEAKRQLGAVPENLLVKEPESDELPLHFLPYLYPAFIHCPKCGSSDLAVTEGEDVQIRRLVLER